MSDYKVDWRAEGVKKDPRYKDVADAERARRRVNQIIPNNPKGKKQGGGRRPNRITAERVHHSRGKKWPQFLEEMGYDKLSESDQLLLMDSFGNGGNEVFARWKQREYDAWVTIKRVVIYDYAFKGRMIRVLMSDGSVVEQPYESEDKQKKKVKVTSGKKRGTSCTTCGVSLPTTRSGSECSVCSQSVTAAAFFNALQKRKKTPN